MAAILNICGSAILFQLTTERLSEGDWAPFSDVMLIPCFVKIGRLVQKFKGGGGLGHGHTQVELGLSENSLGFFLRKTD